MNIIKELMNAKGIDQKELSLRTGIEEGKIARILSPDYNFSMSPKTIESISTALRLTKEENFSIYIKCGVIPAVVKDAFIHKPIAAKAAILLSTLNDIELELMEAESFFDSMLLALREKAATPK